MSQSETTEDISVLTHLSEVTSVTRTPLYTVVASTDPSSIPETITNVSLTAPDGSPVTAQHISIAISSRIGDNSYSNVAETVTPESISIGHLNQLPTPAPSTNLDYDFYSYQTIPVSPQLTPSENSFVSDAEDTGLAHSRAAASFAHFIHQNLSSFDAATDDLSHNYEIESAAAGLNVSGRKFLTGGVLAGVGGGVLTSVEAVGAALGIGAFGAEALGVGLIAGGLYKAYDALNGTDKFDTFLQHTSAIITTGIHNHK